MKIYFNAFLPLALILALRLPAAAQTEITGINWEMSRLEGKARSPFSVVTELPASPDVKFSGQLRAVVSLRNASSSPAEGLVLRYAVRLLLLKKGDAPEKAFWGVPFYVDEVRVSKIGPASGCQVKIIRFEFSEQLRRLKGTGFYPAAVKIEVMTGPRQGDVPGLIIRDSVLNITGV